MRDIYARQVQIEKALKEANPVQKSHCHLEKEGLCPKSFVKPCGKQTGIEYIKVDEDKKSGQIMTVRNWTQHGADNEPYCWGRLRSAHEATWEANFQANKKRIKKMFPKGRPDDDAPKFGQTGYLLGNGPGLKINKDLLKHVKGDIWGCNRHGDLDIDLDYYMVLDAKCKDYETSIKKLNDDVIPVMSVFANPEVTKHFNSENILWYNVWGAGSKLWSNVNRLAEKKFGVDSFSKLDSGFNVCYSMLHAMYKMGYEKIVILGMDYAFSGGYEYFNSDEPFIVKDKSGKFLMDEKIRAKYEGMGGIFETKDMYNQVAFTCKPMKMALTMMQTAMFWLKDNVEIVNCTEAGIDLGIPNEPLERNLG